MQRRSFLGAVGGRSLSIASYSKTQLKRNIWNTNGFRRCRQGLSRTTWRVLEPTRRGILITPLRQSLFMLASVSKCAMSSENDVAPATQTPVGAPIHRRLSFGTGRGPKRATSTENDVAPATQTRANSPVIDRLGFGIGRASGSMVGAEPRHGRPPPATDRRIPVVGRHAITLGAPLGGITSPSSP